MVDSYSWAKQFGREGFTVFNEKSIKILRAIQRKYSDFHGFFTNLTLLYAGQHMTKEQEKAAETIVLRSEERRVGKECRSRWSPYH